MYEGIAILKGEPVARYDEYGNETIEHSESTVFVKPRSVYASEFYSAAQIGITPSIVLIIANRADYNGQKIVEYDGVIYEVVRADWANGRDSISLTLAERVADND